jgi:predicted nucleotidyltransferase
MIRKETHKKSPFCSRQQPVNEKEIFGSIRQTEARLNSRARHLQKPKLPKGVAD